MLSNAIRSRFIIMLYPYGILFIHVWTPFPEDHIPIVSVRGIQILIPPIGAEPPTHFMSNEEPGM
jgi:hypothetical protein